MAKVRVSGSTKVKVKKRPRRIVGGKGDGAFISGTIKAAVKREKEKRNAKS